MSNDHVPSVIETYFQKTFELDVSPDVFDVSIKLSSAFEGYQAILSFRRPHAPGLDYISCKGDTPEAALGQLNKVLEHNFGKCELCGGYKEPKDDNL